MSERDNEERGKLLAMVQDLMKQKGALQGFSLIGYFEGQAPALWQAATTNQMMGGAEVLIAASSEHVPDDCAACTAAGMAARTVGPLVEFHLKKNRETTGSEEKRSCH